MSDYFSHLARASGLAVGKRPTASGVAPHGRVATASHVGAPATRATVAAGAAPGPAHVEHIIFVEQPRDAARRAGEFEGTGDETARPEREGRAAIGTGRGESPVGRSSRRERGSREDARPGSPDDAAHRRTRAPESSSTAREVRPAPPAPEEGSIGFVVTDDAGWTTQGTRRPESISSDAAEESDDSARASSQVRTHAREEVVLVAPHESPDARGARQTHDRADASDARALDSLDPAEAPRAYLREIIEWISAPPSAQTNDEEERVRARRGEREAAEASAVAAIEIVNERDVASAARVRAEAERGPGVDDFTLSIGSIHVVVEEPQGQVNARPAPQSPTPAQSGRATAGDDGVSRLRRHYIRI